MSKATRNPGFEGQLPREYALEYILAGRAVITILDAETGLRFTYRIQRPREDTPHFVRVLSGPDNVGDYHMYVGAIFEGKVFQANKKSGPSRASPDSRSTRLFRFVWERLVSKDYDSLPGRIEIWHEGYCGRCGRSLTVPESIARGIGPVCADIMRVG